MKKQPKNKFIALAVWLTLTFILGACSGEVSGEPTAAIGLAPTTVLIDTPSVANTPTVASTATASATNTVAPTATVEATATTKPTATATTKPTATARPTPTITPLPPPTFTPTAAIPINKALELKMIRAAYDAINKHLFREVDSGEILTSALTELGSVTENRQMPMPAFGKDVESNWKTFSASFEKGIDARPDFKLSQYDLAHRIANAMAIKVGDEHTYFLDKPNYQSRQNLLSGNNNSVGFGILVLTQNSKAYVVRVVPNGPAAQAGVKPGDQISRYDELDITAENWSIIREAKENEAHDFVFSRPSESRTLSVNITKRSYGLPTVEYQLLNNRIGYIAIRDFFTNVAEETDRAMVELRKQGAESWIIDVRDNPGGVNVDQVVGRFVKGGEIMGYNSARNRRDPMKVSNDLSTDSEYKGKPFAPTLPMVVLINDVSASSSEMFALAIRDFKLGPLIGVKTAGALGHTAAYPLGDGSAISVTVDVYESKGGSRVNSIGVSPDTEVERNLDDLVAGRDPQLKAGIEYLEKSANG